MGYIGGGVVLVVLGAILMYAVEISIPGIDSNTLAVILMVAGVVLFVIGLLFAMRSRSRRVPDERY
ncbi:hypothetical protein BXY47_0353 [Dietzia kunjamensis]|jgi:membrane-bound ClpP family serine protease|uniref:Uncharacterized protein n=1 Tax=Dietzia maris TaxID=37915 RepID=A0A365PEC1_9ACTN|nr:MULTISPECIES: hypothetical protein [Dietzia]MBB0992301.1 hypothetical protein [Dietzia sp. SLG510A3-30A2]MBB0994849.1 hypothetical protein [Dietzia sp. SLG510A3-40A3]MBB1008705.1 hypothetical protein [Dietzia sp. SLG510A3-3B2-2]MVZ89523.1 hypothetical protein [Microbacter sp. ANSKLAB05]ODQ83276.1 hypothetical protein BFG51_02060 [Dietzia alimentaria]HBD22379.1 hypothetical protein [Dietzia sp.]